MTQATPMPWYSTPAGIFAEGGEAIAIPIKQPNADLIVRAVNAHDELVAALEEAITWNSHDDEDVPAVWLDQAKAALAKAMYAVMSGEVNSTPASSEDWAKKRSLDLEPIKARAEAATPEPWVASNEGGTAFLMEGDQDGDLLVNDSDGQFFERWDVLFCAHARQDIPALIAEIERLRDEKSTIAADLVLEKLLKNRLSHKIDTAQSILSQTQGGMNGAEPKDMVADLAKLLL